MSMPNTDSANRSVKKFCIDYANALLPIIQENKGFAIRLSLYHAGNHGKTKYNR